MSSALKNLAALKRNISRRLKQALEELQENLGQEGYWGQSPAPARIPVAVPQRSRGFKRMNITSHRCYSTFFGTNHLFWSCRSIIFEKWGALGKNCGFKGHQFRFFSSFCPFSKHGARYRVNTALLTQNFTARNGYHSLSMLRLCKVPSITHLAQKDLCQAFEEEEDRKWNMNMQGAVAQLFSKNEKASMVSVLHEAEKSIILAVDSAAAIPSTLRTNILCSPRYHDLVKRLAGWTSSEHGEANPALDARPVSSTGVYVDFRYGPRILVPQKSILTADVVDEMVDSLARYREKLAEVQEDLARLSELGELPVEVIAEEGVIRVFFPNCDRERLETLLVEKNVVGGVIHEGTPGDGSGSSYESVLSLESLSELDYNYSGSESVRCSSSEELSGGTSWYLSTFTSNDAAMQLPLLSSGSTASSQDNDILSLNLLQRMVRLDESNMLGPVPTSPVAVRIVEEEPVWAL